MVPVWQPNAELQFYITYNVFLCKQVYQCVMVFLYTQPTIINHDF